MVVVGIHRRSQSLYVDRQTGSRGRCSTQHDCEAKPTNSHLDNFSPGTRPRVSTLTQTREGKDGKTPTGELSHDCNRVLRTCHSRKDLPERYSMELARVRRGQ